MDRKHKIMAWCYTLFILAGLCGVAVCGCEEQADTRTENVKIKRVYYDNYYKAGDSFALDVDDTYGTRTFHYQFRPEPTPQVGETWSFYRNYDHTIAGKVDKPTAEKAAYPAELKL